MNNIWLEAIVVLGLGSGIMVLATALFVRVSCNAVWQRTAWQACFMSLSAIIACESTGVLSWTGDSLRHVLLARSASEGTALVRSESNFTDDSSLTPERIEALLAGEEPEANGVGVGGRVVETEATRGRETAGASLVQWLPEAWALGTTLVLARILLSRVFLVLFRRRHCANDDGVLQDRVQTLAQRVGCRRCIHIIDAGGLATPVAFGVARPTLALPRGFVSDFDADQQEVILAHELAHLAARDPAWHLFADLLSAALWWQPLVWWARSQLRHASEAAADEASLLLADGPGTLAGCLVALGNRLVERGQPGWVRMAGSGFRSSLGRRVERLLRLNDTAWRPPTRRRFWLTLTLGSTILAATAFICTVPARSSAPLEGDSNMPTLQQSWRRSLAGLVAVSALATSADSGQAIPQDDPAPKTASAGQPKGVSELQLKGSVDGLTKLPTVGSLFELSKAEPSELVVNQKYIRLPFKIDAARKKGVKEVWLHVESDGGPPWDQPANGNEYFDVKLPSANTYWFSVFTEDENGNRGEKSGPLLQVRVDDGKKSDGADRKETSSADIQRQMDSIEGRLKDVIDKKMRLEEEIQQFRKVAVRPDDNPGIITRRKELDRVLALETQLERERSRLEEDLNAKRTKVFRLKHADAVMLRQTLYSLLGGPSAIPGGPSAPGGMPAGLGTPGGPGMGSMGPLGAGGPGGMMGPGKGGMGGGQMGGGGPPLVASWRIAADRATNSLIVRGLDRDIKLVADVVALLDGEDGVGNKPVGGFTAIRLKHRHFAEVSQVLKELEVDVRIVGDPASNTILVSGSEAAIREVKELLNVLDVDVSPRGGGGPMGPGAGGPPGKGGPAPGAGSDQ